MSTSLSTMSTNMSTSLSTMLTSLSTMSTNSLKFSKKNSQQLLSCIWDLLKSINFALSLASVQYLVSKGNWLTVETFKNIWDFDSP